MSENENNNINDDENKYIYRYKKEDLNNESSQKKMKVPKNAQKKSRVAIRK